MSSNLSIAVISGLSLHRVVCVLPDLKHSKSGFSMRTPLIIYSIALANMSRMKRLWNLFCVYLCICRNPARLDRWLLF